MDTVITVVGIGPGHPDYVLPAAKSAIEQAKVLVGGRRVLADFARKEQKTMTITGDIPATLDFIRQNLRDNDVTVLVSGDPGYYSLLDVLKKNFPPEKIRVIPGISSVQMAFARLALPWHHATLLSFHGRSPAAEDLRFAPEKILGLLTDNEHNSRYVAAQLLEEGWPEDSACYICRRLSYEDESISAATLGEALTLAPVGSAVLVVTAAKPAKIIP
ncbi:MAG: precorrin-6y C5,15-methyltransferase (decarboxylating) subunit CbiE [Selenomonadaceae bacterium]|nr:precorrin-6y C5,15-methyltransferase (decarboxylating) subunit CbiE [Selenomonadaceae bacterium]